MGILPGNGFTLQAGDAVSPEARIGGGALIGGVCPWPVGLSGHPLVLVASLPAAFVQAATGVDIGADRFVSVFTSYVEGSYFLDEITYDGDPVELGLLRQGATRVLVHARGAPVHGPVEVPARRIHVDAAGRSPEASTFVGGEPVLLQEEDLDVDGLVFALQIYGGDLPEPFRGLFYLTDAIGYLYVPREPAGGVDDSGLFFAQVT